MKVQNLTSNKGNKIANQFEIIANNGRYFQSYNSIICFIDNDNKVTLDSYYWDYSKTTSKYRNIFLNEDTKTIKEKINKGIYKLANLN